MLHPIAFDMNVLYTKSASVLMIFRYSGTRNIQGEE